MLNKLKIAKNILFFFLALALFSSFMFWKYPEYYISYKTGYNAELIRNFRDAAQDKYTFPVGAYDKACENFNSKTVATAYGEMGKISLTLIEISFIIIIFFVLALRFNKEEDNLKQFKKLIIISVVVLLVALSIFFLADTAEIDLDFLTACKGIITNGNLFDIK